MGEKNRFYYDEKLKRWVEEGAEPPPPEEAVLPPPPTTAAFQNGMPDYNVKDAPKTGGFPLDLGLETKSPISSERSSGIPPIPPSSNQFSARGRMGVRSRYSFGKLLCSLSLSLCLCVCVCVCFCVVIGWLPGSPFDLHFFTTIPGYICKTYVNFFRYVDTFNKGGGTPSNLFQTPSIPAAKPVGGSNPKFFIPAPVASVVETVQTPGESMQEATLNNANPPTSFKEDSISSTQKSTLPSMSLQRFPSMDNIVQRKTGPMAHGTSLVPPPSRRTASWSGNLSDGWNPSMMNEVKPLGEVLGVSPSLYRPGDPLSVQFPSSRNSSRDDLHEVEL